MIAVTKPVQDARKHASDAWHLILDKLSYERNGGATAKTGALKEIIGYHNKLIPGILSLVCNTRQRFLRGLEQQYGKSFATVELVLESRLLLHLGRASVLENVGLYFERTTGLPQIPGTALKGIVSTWACWGGHFNPADGSFKPFTKESTIRSSFTAAEAGLARQILGDDSPDGSEHAGDVIFVGGFPSEPPRLGLDIVNPHFEPDGSHKKRLTPNTFLCVEPGSTWKFAFFVRPGAPNPDELISTTRRWIQDALTQIGIGAKTAAGYGRFRLLTEAEPKIIQGGTRSTPKSQGGAQPQNEVIKMLASDYSNEKEFHNKVLSKLNPGMLDQLKSEIDSLQKPENASWHEKLKKLLASKECKDIRKRLRQKDWFPKDWLPPQ